MYVTRTIHGTKRFAEGKLAELLMEVGRTAEVTTDGTLADLVQKWRPIAEENLWPTTPEAIRFVQAVLRVYPSAPELSLASTAAVAALPVSLI